MAERLTTLQRDKCPTLIDMRDGNGTLDLGCSRLFSKTDQKGSPEYGLKTDYDFAIMYFSNIIGRPKGVIQTHRRAFGTVFSCLIQGQTIDILTPTRELNFLNLPPSHHPNCNPDIEFYSNPCQFLL